MHKSRIWLDWVWLKRAPSCPHTLQNAALEATRPPPLLPPPPLKRLPPPSHTLWSELHAHCPETWWTIQPYGNFSSQQASVSYICVCQPEWMQRQQRQQQWLGSGVRQPLSDILLQLGWEGAHFLQLSSQWEEKFSLFLFSSLSRFYSFMNEWGRMPCNLRILFSSRHKVDALSSWLGGCDAELRAPRAGMTAASRCPRLLLLFFLFLFCLGAPLWHARVKVSRISHPPPTSLRLCCDPVPQRRTWPEGFPGKTKGLNHELCSRQETHSAIIQRTVRSDESQLWVCLSFSFSAAFSQSREIPWVIEWILFRRHDLDLRGNRVMCAQVHVWEVSACIFNVAFYFNEHSGGCAAGEMWVIPLEDFTHREENTLDWICFDLVTYWV